jgi:hypothetical protein
MDTPAAPNELLRGAASRADGPPLGNNSNFALGKCPHANATSPAKRSRSVQLPVSSRCAANPSRRWTLVAHDSSCRRAVHCPRSGMCPESEPAPPPCLQPHCPLVGALYRPGRLVPNVLSSLPSRDRGVLRTPALAPQGAALNIQSDALRPSCTFEKFFRQRDPKRSHQEL